MSETLALPDFDCSLVSLSTCYSADGTNEVGEGVNSLARGFRLAGARTILASTREVNDQISYNILLKFYGRLRTNIPPDVAMQQALEVYLAEEKGAAFTQPLYWGNFVLIGSMDVLPSKWPLYQLILPIVGIISGLLVWKWRKHRKTRNA